MLSYLESCWKMLKPIPTFSEILDGAEIPPEPQLPPIIEPNEYTCAHCGGIFNLGPDEAPREEFAKNFPGERIEDAARICDGCFKEFNKWMQRMEKTN
jgi:hypothetical protein